MGRSEPGRPKMKRSNKNRVRINRGIYTRYVMEHGVPQPGEKKETGYDRVLQEAIANALGVTPKDVESLNLFRQAAGKKAPPNNG